MGAGEALQAAATLRVQNLLLLCQQLHLPVQYKVHEVAGSGPQGQQRRFTVVVHVHGDHAFKKYLNNCSQSDLLLFRGLLLTVVTDATLQQLCWAEVQQAFLPKFENEGQDQSIAADIVAGASDRYQVITIKHSGSLVTLSADGFAAKNSVNNAFTAAGALLLLTHYQRLCGDQGEAEQKVQRLLAALREQHLVVSFEMVTGCHGHHGQIPAGEYLVATAAHTRGTDGAPRFLPWVEFLDMCLQLQLPVNDTWLIAGQQQAADARQLLDDVSLAPRGTGDILQQLNQLTDGGAAGSSSSSDGHGVHSIHLPGTYPHDQWQGSRLEGFVIAQGQPISGDTHQQLQLLQGRMAQQVIQLDVTPQQLRQPYAQLVAKAEATEPALKRSRSNEPPEARGGPVAPAAAVAAGYALEECSRWLPPMDLVQVEESTGMAVIHLVKAAILPVDPATCALHLPDGSPIFSRAALCQAAAALQRQQQQPGSASSTLQQLAPDLTQQLQEALTAAEAAAAEQPVHSGRGDASSMSDRAVIALLQRVACSNVAEQRAVLRYKKKMNLYSAEVVGYCMMTFVIRNGLPSLRMGRPHYMQYLSNLARRSWKLPEALVDKVLRYGRCWAHWIKQHGGIQSVDSNAYLDKAEPFAADFLAGRAEDVDPGSRAPGAFQGVLMAVHVPEDVLYALTKRLQLTSCLMGPEACDPATRAQKEVQQQQEAQDVAQSSKPRDRNKQEQKKGSGPAQQQHHLFFSRHQVTEGSYLNFTPDVGMANKAQLSTYLHLAAPYVYIVAPQPTVEAAKPPAEGQGQQQEQQKQKGRQRTPNTAAALNGMLNSKVGQLQKALTGNGVNALERTHFLPALPEGGQEASPEVWQQWVAEAVESVARWAGAGTQLQAAPPTYACCFTTIPGMGKTHLCGLLQQQGVPMGQLEVLHGDVLDKTQGKRGMRYWAEVAGAVSKAQAAGRGALVVADKNLVPMPPNMFQDAAEALRLSGAITIALVPTVQYDPPVPPSSLPAMPLELVALCMLRVLQRKDHHVGLDSSHGSLCEVVALFGSFYAGQTQQQLVNQLEVNFDHVAPMVVGRVDAQHQVAQEVLEHVAEGLHQAAASSRNRKKGERATTQEWEATMRHLLTQPQHQTALQALQLPATEVAANVQQVLQDIVSGARQPGSGVGAAAAGSGVRWYGIKLADQGALQQQLAKLLEQQQGRSRSRSSTPAQQQQQQQGVEGGGAGGATPMEVEALEVGEFPSKVAGNLHVTLWHQEGGPGPEGLVEGLAACVGQEVTLQLAALDLGPQAVAAQVHLLEAPEAVQQAWQRLSYPHVTVAKAKGVKGVASLQLPAQVADPSHPAFGVVLPEPLTIKGQLMPFT